MKEYEPVVQLIEDVNGLSKLKVLLKTWNQLPAMLVVDSFAASIESYRCLYKERPGS